jgi:uncharacterized protein (UPF0297 family)
MMGHKTDCWIFECEVPEMCMEDKNQMDKTVQFDVVADSQDVSSRHILLTVHDALVEKEYHPINQIVGYLLSGDPAYIPRHNNARSLIRKKERDELIEELVRFYLQHQR